MNSILDNLVGKQVKAIKDCTIEVNNKNVNINGMKFNVHKDEHIGEFYIDNDDFWTSIHESEIGNLFIKCSK